MPYKCKWLNRFHPTNHGPESECDVKRKLTTDMFLNDFYLRKTSKDPLSLRCSYLGLHLCVEIPHFFEFFLKKPHTFSVLVPQPSFIKWIVDQFRRLRRPRCRSTETKERLLNSKSQMSECRQQGPDHLAQSHQKSYSIAVPDHQAIRARKSTSSTQNIAPELRLPAPTLSTKQKLSDFGSLRRCFSLAEDASHEQGLVNGDTPVSKVFPPFRPNAASGPSEGCVKTSNPPMSVPQSVNFSNRPRWISHLDLFGSPSCSSLIVNPPFRVDRSPLHPLGPPSQSGSRLALHRPSADRTTDWHYTNHARQSSLCTPSHMTLHLRKRPATRDSGFVESDSVHPQTQPPDRSAGYSISPLSRSSDGARSFFATDTTSMAMPAVIPQTSYVWWTTGFLQHAVPQRFTPGPISRCSGYQPTSGLMEYSIR
ncbi:unnamed protein product [Dicrocoelium dendriticum]|nr:unnamed protein product [Dicrocoelium dendriticum]